MSLRLLCDALHGKSIRSMQSIQYAHWGIPGDPRWHVVNEAPSGQNTSGDCIQRQNPCSRCGHGWPLSLAPASCCCFRCRVRQPFLCRYSRCAMGSQPSFHEGTLVTSRILTFRQSVLMICQLGAARPWRPLPLNQKRGSSNFEMWGLRVCDLYISGLYLLSSSGFAGRALGTSRY